MKSQLTLDPPQIFAANSSSEFFYFLGARLLRFVKLGSGNDGITGQVHRRDYAFPHQRVKTAIWFKNAN